MKNLNIFLSLHFGFAVTISVPLVLDGVSARRIEAVSQAMAASGPQTQVHDLAGTVSVFRPTQDGGDRGARPSLSAALIHKQSASHKLMSGHLLFVRPASPTRLTAGAGGIEYGDRDWESV